MSYEEFLIYSARLGELEDLKECIEEKVDLETTDPSGNTALRKSDPNNVIHSFIRYIDMASANGHLEIVKLLLQHGAKPNSVNKSKNTPLRKR